ncbi:MAG: imidazole glycerol phosphate synthase subunit HisH [Proteobacteria bacterium]|nr:imidazole glycerol phosphate synthase subunit HisH [Pseudomonadota bacterium]
MQNSKIVIIDYGSGNLKSVLNACQLIKGPDQEVIISSDAKDLKSATHIILPGVGAFGDCMNGLKAIPSMIDELKQQVLVNKKPFLGICVGMQLLATTGYENGETEGLNFISGKVTKIDNHHNILKIPHMGWNDLALSQQQHPLLKNIKNGDHAYFVHSYHFICNDKNTVLATVDYGSHITAIIAKDNIIATQFHPEKSSDTGLTLLKNFINS